MVEPAVSRLSFPLHVVVFLDQSFWAHLFEPLFYEDSESGDDINTGVLQQKPLNE